MTTSVQNTRISMLVDAITVLVLANIAHTNKKVEGARPDIVQAEDALAEALRVFLLPALRVIDCEPNGESDFKVTCCTCGAAKPCEMHCKSWAASVRQTVGGENGTA